MKQYLFPFPNWLVRFVKSINLTPQDLLFKTKKQKNDCFSKDNTFLPERDSTCINMIFNGKTEPEVMYGDALQRHINILWDSRIYFSREELFFSDDDVKGAFRHSKYHPDKVWAFSYVISKYFMVPLRKKFGSLVSPHIWKPLARARTHLEAVLSYRSDLLAEYQSLISKV